MNVVGIRQCAEELCKELDVTLVMEGNVHENLLREDLTYPLVNLEFTEVAILPNHLVRYNMRWTYAERDLDDESNKLDAWAEATRFFAKVLRSIEKTFVVRDDVVECDTELHPQFFHQQFADLTSGAYCNMTLLVSDEQCD